MYANKLSLILDYSKQLSGVNTPSKSIYENLGLENIKHLNILNEVIRNVPEYEIDNIKKIQNTIDTVNIVFSQEFNLKIPLAQVKHFTSIGIHGVDEKNISIVNKTIHQHNDISILKLQSFIWQLNETLGIVLKHDKLKSEELITTYSDVLPGYIFTSPDIDLSIFDEMFKKDK